MISVGTGGCGPERQGLDGGEGLERVRADAGLAAENAASVSGDVADGVGGGIGLLGEDGSQAQEGSDDKADRHGFRV